VNGKLGGLESLKKKVGKGLNGEGRAGGADSRRCNAVDFIRGDGEK